MMSTSERCNHGESRYDLSGSAQVAEVARDRLGAGPDPSRLAQQRARLVQWEQRQWAPQRGPRGSGWAKPFVFGGGLAVALVALWVYGVPVLSPDEAASSAGATSPLVRVAELAPGSSDQPGGLTATLSGRALATGAWVNAEEQPAVVAFSDKSRVQLPEGSKVRLAELDGESVGFTIESGELTASVTPGGRHRWVFSAGPYEVSVLGTVLFVNWEPESEALSVQVSRGKVRVSGGQIDAAGRIVAAGESFRVSPPEKIDSAAAEGPGLAAVSAVVRSSPGARAELSPATSSAVKSPAVKSPGPAESFPSWRALAEQGEYQRALAAAESQGFAAVVGNAGAADLLLLADTARLAGSASKAKSVLQTLRGRYPGHANSHVAAFTLGRMAYARDDKSAVRWFRTYLSAAPSGPLAQAAQGRLMLSLSRLGSTEAAKGAAETYLTRYPRGPHASAARSLLSKR